MNYRKKLSSQNNKFIKHVRKAATCTKGRYVTVAKLSQMGKLIFDTKLIKECIVFAFHEYCPKKMNSINEIGLSH